jgi:retron-type reverse transcriptase
MPLLRWIQSLFGKPPTRDVSRLGPSASAEDTGSTAPDTTEETIDTSGGLVKPGHRRRSLRDPRLFPKIQAPVNLRFGKRPKEMPKSEADRLFGATLRTRNRRLRDLVTDEDQLARLGLPVWKTERDVAEALGISLGMLWHFASHRVHERCVHYIAFEVPKRSGGSRVIFAPKRRLKALQRQLNELLVRKLPVSTHAHGFVTGRSIRTGADPHVGRAFVLHLDLKDFFPSVTFARVRGLLIAYGYAYPVAATLAALCTESRRQPVEIDGELFHVPVGQRHCVQGAPTSPGLCNAMVLRLDRRLAGLARKFQCNYTRYADDLTFSGDASRGAMIGLRERATEIIRAEGFEVNREKTSLASKGARQTVTGVVVNQVAGLSRQDRRRMRAEAHQRGLAEKSGKPVSAEAVARFEGKLAYLAMLNPAQAEAIRGRM